MEHFWFPDTLVAVSAPACLYNLSTENVPPWNSIRRHHVSTSDFAIEPILVDDSAKVDQMVQRFVRTLLGKPSETLSNCMTMNHDLRRKGWPLLPYSIHVFTDDPGVGAIDIESPLTSNVLVQKNSNNK